MGKALLVYESMWGNTEKVARAIADGIGDSMEVELCEVSAAPQPPSSDLALIVVGAPTHAFGLSRVGTREDARKRGAEGGGETGVREWLDHLPGGPHTQRLATFDTRVTTMRHLPGSAARSAARAARHHGYRRTGDSESFYVADVDGPLVDGELERARAWGRRIAATVPA